MHTKVIIGVFHFLSFQAAYNNRIEKSILSNQPASQRVFIGSTSLKKKYGIDGVLNSRVYTNLFVLILLT